MRLVNTHHSNGTPITTFQIIANRSTLPKTFHLVMVDDKTIVKLKSLRGQKIAVIGNEFFCSQTAWQIGDAVLMKWCFVETDKR